MVAIAAFAPAARGQTQPAAVAPHATHDASRLTGTGSPTPEALHAAAAKGIDVLTRSYNNARTGANVHESTLTPDRVRTSLQRLFTLDVMKDAEVKDDPRLEAQPLIVTGLKIGQDQAVHDVAYVCTMANNVWAFDAKTGDPLWPKPRNLGTPITPIAQPADGFPTRSEIDLWGINIRWGILSTPVIDREEGAMYVVCWTSATGKRADAKFMLNKIRLTDGTDVVQPVAIEAKMVVGGQTATFNPPSQKQRAALLLAPVVSTTPTHGAALSGGHPAGAHGGDHAGGAAPATGPAAEHDEAPAKVLIMACGMMGENNHDQHGWVCAFDTATLRRTAAWCTTPTTFGGGIWQAGQGPAADDFGDIYFMTANGGFNGVTDFAESFVRLRYTPPTADGQDGAFTVVEHFTPYLDAGRTAHEPGTGYSFQDQDLGSAGTVVPRGIPFVFGAGKDGVLYVTRKGTFGNTSLDDIRNHLQYAKLASPPIFFTYFPGFNVDPTNVADLDHNYFGLTHHLHSTPVYFNSPDLGPMLFCWGENERLRAWSVSKDGVVGFLASGQEVASNGSPVPLGGMPGGMITLSANGKQPHTSVVWASVPIGGDGQQFPRTGDGNRFVVKGIVRAYDATAFATNQDGSKSLALLWDSDRDAGGPVQFHYDKFCPPVVANGKLYVTTYDGHVDVYGLK